MKNDLGRCAAVLGVGMILATLFLSAAPPGGPAATADQAIAGWPETAKLTAKVMIEKYGKPNRVTDTTLIWYGNEPWKRTVVYRDGWLDESFIRHPEVLEQVITYWMPRDRIRDLMRFDNLFTVNSVQRELSFRSNSERANFLAMNLANDVVTGSRTIAGARAYSAKATKLSEAGKTVTYGIGFIFEVKNEPSPQVR